MTTSIAIWCTVLAFFGLNTAVVAYFVVRITTNALWGLLAFNAILMATCWGIVQIVHASI